MATLTKEQIGAKKQQLKQLSEEVKQLKEELEGAGAVELSDFDLEKAAGGAMYGLPGIVGPVNPLP